MRERLTGLLAACGLLAGCGAGGPGVTRDDAAVRRVSVESFAERPASRETDRPDRPAADPAPDATGGDRTAGGVPGDEGAVVGAFGAAPVVVRGVTPPAQAPAPQARRLELIDAKVGDINGRPIYVSSFFEPIEARLIAEAGRLNRNEWRRVAVEEIIQPRLDGIIADELLRAEALAALTPAQRQGLRSFLTGFRRDLLSENLGSEQLARRRLEESSGRSLDEALREKETDTLISLALFRQINRKVNVSWRDIRQRYERDANVYNPPPTARFRMIRVATERDEDVARVTERLAAGEPFEEVAQDPANSFERDRGGLTETSFTGEYAQATFFGSDTLNQQARSLEPGGVAGPFEVGTGTMWLKLEGVERTSISLYDAQLRINQELTLERRRAEQRAYLDRLKERARVSNRDEMLIRLLRIAEERYGPRR